MKFQTSDSLTKIAPQERHFAFWSKSVIDKPDLQTGQARIFLVSANNI